MAVGTRQLQHGGMAMLTLNQPQVVPASDRSSCGQLPWWRLADGGAAETLPTGPTRPPCPSTGLRAQDYNNVEGVCNMMHTMQRLSVQ